MNDDYTTVALGVFDGVHLGHRSLLGAARDHAQLMGTSLIALSFWPHPRSVVTDKVVPLLSTREERIELLLGAGADRVEILDFTPEFSRITAEGFMQTQLVDRFHARAVAVGTNFRFGYRAAGSHKELADFSYGSGPDGFATLVCEVKQDAGAAISSSRIRDLIANTGDMVQAARLLDRAYSLAGKVVQGEQRGRELGYPTANMAYDPALVIPADGVYAGHGVVNGDAKYLAAISVGTNPHFTGDDPAAARTVEAYLLDFHGELDSLYGEDLKVSFAERLRGQESYDSLESLIAAIANDVADVRRLLA